MPKPSPSLGPFDSVRVPSKRGRPVGSITGTAKTSTERVRHLRQVRLDAGGTELSMVLRAEPSIALAIIGAISDAKGKGAIVEAALIAYAKSLLTSVKIVTDLVDQNKLTENQAKTWISLTESFNLGKNNETSFY
jgi:hypothetical protein